MNAGFFDIDSNIKSLEEYISQQEKDKIHEKKMDALNKLTYYEKKLLGLV